MASSFAAIASLVSLAFGHPGSARVGRDGAGLPGPCGKRLLLAFGKLRLGAYARLFGDTSVTAFFNGPGVTIVGVIAMIARVAVFHRLSGRF